MIVEGVDGPSGPAMSGLIGTSAEGVAPISEMPSAVTACKETVDSCSGVDVRPLSKHLILSVRAQQ